LSGLSTGILLKIQAIENVVVNPVADVDPLLPHGVEKHRDAIQGLSDVWHGHGGAGPPEAE